MYSSHAGSTYIVLLGLGRGGVRTIAPLVTTSSLGPTGTALTATDATIARCQPSQQSPQFGTLNFVGQHDHCRQPRLRHELHVTCGTSDSRIVFDARTTKARSRGADDSAGQHEADQQACRPAVFSPALSAPRRCLHTMLGITGSASMPAFFCAAARHVASTTANEIAHARRLVGLLLHRMCRPGRRRRSCRRQF